MHAFKKERQHLQMKQKQVELLLNINRDYTGCFTRNSTSKFSSTTGTPGVAHDRKKPMIGPLIFGSLRFEKKIVVTTQLKYLSSCVKQIFHLFLLV